MTLGKFRRRKGCTRMPSLVRTVSLYSWIVLTLLALSQVAYCDPAPDFSLNDIDGNTFSLSDFRGSIVILNFMSSTCSACKYEVNQLKLVRDELGGGVVIVSISWVYSADTDEKLRIRRDEWSIDWILAKDTEDVTGKYDVPRIPTVFVIDHESNKRYSHVDGAQAPVLIEEIDRLLTEMTDLNLDGKVDETDASVIAMAFGLKLGEEDYEERMDFDDDGTIDMRDVAKVAIYVGNT